MKIAVIGTGYVGLVTGTCFAESGNDVTCIDKDAAQDRRRSNAARCRSTSRACRSWCAATARTAGCTSRPICPAASRAAQLIFIAVGTPQADDGSADLSAVFAVADAIAAHHERAEDRRHQEHGPGRHQSRPSPSAWRSRRSIRSTWPAIRSFSRKGPPSTTCMKPDRVVVGVRRPEVGEVLQELYAPFLRTERPFLVMSPESAEMTKYVANAMLATKISFINEMANLCERWAPTSTTCAAASATMRASGFSSCFPARDTGAVAFPKTFARLLACLGN